MKVFACPLCSQWVCGISPSHSLADWVIPSDFLQMCSSLRFLTAKDCDISAIALQLFCWQNMNLTTCLSHWWIPWKAPVFFFFSPCSSLTWWYMMTIPGEVLKCNPLTQTCNEQLTFQPFLLALFLHLVGLWHHWESLFKCNHVSRSWKREHQQAFRVMSCFSELSTKTASFKFFPSKETMSAARVKHKGFSCLCHCLQTWSVLFFLLFYSCTVAHVT